ncbi:hypothetical protein, partial [Bacteroides heparinolyticus]
GREFKGIAPLSQPKAETFLQQKFLFTTTLNFAKVSNIHFADEDVWLTQRQLAEIYDTTQQNTSWKRTVTAQPSRIVIPRLC